MLLNARFHHRDLLDLGIDRDIGAEEGDQVGDLVVSEYFRHFLPRKEDADVVGVKMVVARGGEKGSADRLGSWSDPRSQFVETGRKKTKKTDATVHKDVSIATARIGRVVY